MAQFSEKGLAPWVQKRLLAYLNRAEVPTDITSGVLVDDPFAGSGEVGYTIGEVVASRILERRESLPGHRFTEISQLNGIAGLGEDKFNDLVYSMAVPAAEAFKKAMYRKVLFENWQLDYVSYAFEDADHFHAVTSCESHLRDFIAEKLSVICESRYGNPRAGEIAGRTLEGKWMEAFSSGQIASHALALWFYRFDEDNWFSYEQVRKQAEMYLDFFGTSDDLIELRLFKGFENDGVLADAITVPDLPVVVNHVEQKVTIWSCQLND